ncbi:DsbA family oxidoreductase [Phreatobacter sp. AB_2022a]|uniref:DsbA family oxidoreductase n=1 Tax=Phreatobacter sp. AB_2022a TaxID=3003134 RepID=UPI002286D4B4|nr:DsbA family oxidoreductase [Phreatobacter sp. AB_2022a]MCZ0733561.1 DsbA family oxidoreductase [Phreatobacter sp. AB_2022a]
MPDAAVTIDVVSDVVCPWCFIGKRRLEKAVALVPDIAVEVRWRPYQLAPDLPAAGIPRDQYLTQKFGSLDRVKANFARIAAVGAEDGIDFAFDRITVSPNTLNAHRLVLWARSGGHQDAVVEALFNAYFVEGRNLADISTLIEIGAAHGLDAALLTELFASDSDIERTQREIASAQRIGVTGVPFFIVGERFGIAGAEAPETIARAIRQAAEAEASADAAAGAAGHA